MQLHAIKQLLGSFVDRLLVYACDEGTLHGTLSCNGRQLALVFPADECA